MFTIKLIKWGEPLPHKEVTVSFTGLRGWQSERTDKNGEAHFDVNDGEAKIIVDGWTVETKYCSGKVVVHVP